MTLRERAISYLARREHSRAELAQKLAAHAEADEIALLLDDLEARNYLSDKRFATALRQSRNGRHGSLKLRQELREKGVDESISSPVLDEARSSDEAAARVVWQKKFGQPPADMKDRARQFRFLLSRGFPMDVVRRVVGGGEPE